MPHSRRFAPVDLLVARRADGSILLRSGRDLEPHFPSLGHALEHWAERAPQRAFLAEATENGFRSVSYFEVLQQVRRLGAAMLQDGLGPDRPVVVLSDNSVDHALVALAALYVGVPLAPLSPAYSLLSQDHQKLRHLVEQLRPGWIYVDSEAPFERALDSVATGPRIVSRAPAGRATALEALLDADPAGAQEALAQVGPETRAKLLFTSGSTGWPKGVINTQKMLCTNQQALLQGWPFLRERPPVIVDWLPWSHTFGGNHNFNLVLWNGGTLYVDRGKPVPGRIEASVALLRQISPTLYFNVPRGFDALLPFLERDDVLASKFFAELDLVFYAAAALPRPTWDRLRAVSRRIRGVLIPFVSAWGATETAPLATQVHYHLDEPGNIGVPAAATEIKLAPVGNKLEIRVKGPQLTPGYLDDPERLSKLLDEEGFYQTGDAARLADPDDPDCGLVFDGRIAEDFKLTSGTWVHVGALRLNLLRALSPLVQDIAIAGHDRDSVAALLFPDLAACAALVSEALPPEQLLAHPAVREVVRSGLAAHNREVGGASSMCVKTAILLAEPPSLDKGEITDKGYLNQRQVLNERAIEVERLFEGHPTVILAAC